MTSKVPAQRRGHRAAVLGSGMAGLAAARVLSDHFDEVVVFERDTLPDRPVPRDGTPQARHPHTLLRGGVLVLGELFPDFIEVLLSEGAVPFDPLLKLKIERPGVVFDSRETGIQQYGATRSVFEFAVRTCLAKSANVMIRDRHRIRELVGSPERVTGVIVDSPEGRLTESFDFVVDASGRGAPTLAFLSAHGLGQPIEESVGLDLMYATTMFERTPRSEREGWLGAITFCAPPNFRGAVMTPISGNRWHVLAMGRHGEEPPAELPAFLEYLGGLPTRTVHDAVVDATPAADIVRFKFPESTWRRFDRFTELPESLLVVGDGVAKVNPFYAQGMTLAVRQVEVLRRLLATSEPLATIAAPFYRDTREIIESAWSLNTMMDFQHPSTRGERPADLAQKIAFSDALARVAMRDPEVQDVFWKVQQLMLPPSALRERRFVVRVIAEMKATAARTSAGALPE